MITERIDNITRIPENYRSITPPPPKSVKIELTSRCNYKCGFCPIVVREEMTRDIDFRFFKNITSELMDLGVEEIGVFFMGESFTSKELLVKSIKWLKNHVKMPYIFLTSNASLADPVTVERCMVAGLDSLKWSVNFADKDQFREICGVKDIMMDKAIYNIQQAHEVRNHKNYETKLYASSIRYNDVQFDKMKKLLDESIIPYVDQHYWLPLYSMGSLATKKENELGLQPIAGNPGRYDNPVDPIPCWSLFTEGHIMSDGRLTGCCADATGEWVMGDLNTQSFMEAWQSKEFRQLRKEHLKGNVIGTKCEHCVIYK